MSSLVSSFFGGGATPAPQPVTPAPVIDTKSTPPVDANAADYAKQKLEQLKARQGRSALKVDPDTGTQTSGASTGLAIP